VFTVGGVDDVELSFLLTPDSQVIWLSVAS
jgi:hypothetical protein